jgi:hypothetical protein
MLFRLSLSQLYIDDLSTTIIYLPHCNRLTVVSLCGPSLLAGCIVRRSSFSATLHISSFTTGIRGFAECCILCRVPFVGHSAKKTLPSAALDKVMLSAQGGTRQRQVCRVSNTRQRGLSANPSAAVPELTAVSLCRESTAGTRQRGFFAECHIVDTRQSTLCRVSYLDTRQIIFLFFKFCLSNFLWYVPTLCRPTCIICG